jgi:peptidyl-prolyl cis-trans isomerase D
MSIIQRIREKGALISAIIIGLSLLGFILMDALSGRANLFDGSSNNIGSVNGESIKYNEFNLAYNATIEQYKAQGYTGDQASEQALQQAWTQEVNDRLLEDEYEALGLSVSDAEFNDFLFVNPPADLKQQFTDSLGRYNASQLQARLKELKAYKGNDPKMLEQKIGVDQYLTQLRKQRLDEKYQAIFSSTIYVPKWMVEKRIAEASLIGNVSYVAVPYTTISDSAVKVTDEEIRSHMEKNKKDFKQEQESRTISYVLFNVAPSASDSAQAREKLTLLKTGFDTTTKYEDFLARNNSRTPFYDGYINKANIQQPNKDSILSAPVGVVYGPYLDGSNYVYSKIIGVRTQPDTVKVRHILVATQQRDPQSGQSFQVRDDSTAKKLIDSIQAAHKAGSSFDTLVAQLSEDPGSKDKGGVYENITAGGMVPAFNDFIFGNPTGATGVVKTEFGYHYIEILSQKGSSPAYKVAYLTVPIATSQRTEEAIYNQARMFRAGVDDLESFKAAADKELRPKGINVLVAPDITPIASNVPGIGNSRTFVRAIYDVDRGEIIGPEKIDNAYVVAVVTDIEEPGMVSVARARMRVGDALKNKKKAEMIKKNIGTITTLEAVSAKTGQPIQTADSLRMGGNNNPISFETKVVGATFNPANKGKVVTEAIEGQSGVFVIRVNSTGTAPVFNASVDEMRKQMEQQARQGMMYQKPVDVLRKNANVKDNRANFF